MRSFICSAIIAMAAIMPGSAIEKHIDYNEFSKLMGKGTPHWKHLQRQTDLAMLDCFELLYQKNKDAQFSAFENRKIPPVLHFIWLGPKTFPPKSVENLRSWIAYHPDWQIKFWTDREREPPCAGIEMIDISNVRWMRLERCFHDSQNWAEKSDLLRYEILLEEGGVYVDHDTYCLASFDPLVRGYDFFCCLEAPHEPFAGYNITIWNGLIGSCPGHPVLAKVIDLIDNRWNDIGQRFRGRDLYSQVEIVMQRTYIAFTQAMEGSLDQSGNTDIVFPAAYFFAKSGIPSIYSKHFSLTMWDSFKYRKSEIEKFKERSISKIRRKGSKGMYVAGGFFLLSSLFLTCSIKSIRRRGDENA